MNDRQTKQLPIPRGGGANYTNNTLTTDVSVKLRIYTLLLHPLVVSPPNNIALELLIDVKVKSLIGSGLSPVIVGNIHCP